MAPMVSVIVRAKDKASTIGRTLASLRRQTVPVEIIVVDSGSTDGTVDIAAAWADRIIEIPSSSFSYGGALNAGAAAASCRVHAALSAHGVPLPEHWLEASLRRYERADVAATNQAEHTPTGRRITGTYHQTLDDIATHPRWGFSNHASTWLAEVWRELPFREDLPACEDIEWSWRVLASGRCIAYSPELDVPMTHRRSAGPRDLVRRAQREAQAMVSLGAGAPLTARSAVRAWWTCFPDESPKPRLVRRASPYRVAELLGAWSGSRRVPVTDGRVLAEILQPAGRVSTRDSYVPWA